MEPIEYYKEINIISFIDPPLLTQNKQQKEDTNTINTLQFAPSELGKEYTVY